MILFVFILLVVILIVTLFVLKYSTQRKYHIYTITNTMEKWELQRLEKSVKVFNGGKLNIIYTQDKIGRLPVGYGPKVMRLYEQIRDLPPNDVVVFVDAFDVLLIAPFKELIQKYESMKLGDTLIFSAEKSGSCWPTSHQYEKYCEGYKKQNKEPVNGEYGYLNSGMFMGTVRGIKSVIESRWRSINQTIDDQGFYGQTYLYSMGQIVLDHKCELFQNLMGDHFKDLLWDTSKKRWYNKFTKSYPCIAQGEGDAKSRATLFEIVGPAVSIS